MSCTTILAGKKATYDGSTMIARNDDSPSGLFAPKKFVVVEPDEQAREYQSKMTGQKVELPKEAFRYTCCPNATGSVGIWAASGVNEYNVGMTATETITSNPRVQGADPVLEFVSKSEADQKEKPASGGIGEEDFVVLVLPYIKTAREGVLRLGELLEKYGTYESNGIAFSDSKEVWYMETIGGHHWMAKRVPDDRVVIMPNQLGIDSFDLKDAFGKKEDHLCSADMEQFIAKFHLDLTPGKPFDPRATFGSHDDADHVYNTPRAWYMGRYLNPHTYRWDGAGADFRPESDDIPWSLIPEKKLTVEDVKYLLSSHYQGTPFDPYATYGETSMRGAYRSIGINRNDFMALIQIRGDVPEAFRSVEWLAFASNAFNAMAPFYTNIHRTPAYLSGTTQDASTEQFYWVSRLIAALSDAAYSKNLNHIEHYENAVLSKGHEILNRYDEKMSTLATQDQKIIAGFCETANEEVAAMLKKQAQKTLNSVLYEASNTMKNCYARSDT